jgi:hypothetical protein
MSLMRILGVVALGIGLAVVVALGLGAMASTTAGVARSAEATELTLVGEDFPVMFGRGDDIMGKPGIAFDGTNYFAVWYHPAEEAINGARVSPAGTVVDTQAITISASNDSTAPPSVVFDGINFYVVWIATRSGTTEIYGARVDTSGNVLDPEGVQITTGGIPKVRMPGIAFDGTNLLVAWGTTDDDIYATRVSTAGVNLDAPGGFLVTTGGSYYPSVAIDGTNFLVVWHDSRNSGTGWDVYGARVTTGGIVLDPGGFVISDDPMHQEHTHVAYGDGSYLIVWYDWRPDGQQIMGSLYGTRVLTDGTVLDDPAFFIADEVRGQVSPKVTYDGTNWVVVYMEEKNEPADWRLTDVFAFEILSNGQKLNEQAIPVITSFGHQYGPTVGCGGGRCLVAWGDIFRPPGEPESSLYAQLLERQAVDTRAEEGTARRLPLTGPGLQTSAQITAPWLEESTELTWYGIGGLAFRSNDAYVFGSGQAVHYTGTTFVSEPAFPGYPYGSWAGGRDDIWISGWCRGFSHWDGNSWVDHGCWTTSEAYGNASAVWRSGTSDLWATTTAGDILRFDGVWNWERIPTGLPIDLADLWGTSPTNIYAVGERGTILHYAGSTWTPVPSVPTIQTLNAIWGFDADDIFVVGDWGTILHYDGVQWIIQDGGTVEHLYDVWGTNGADVYAVGFDGTVLHYDGASWQAEDSTVDFHLLSVWGVIDPAAECETIWAAGVSTSVIKKTIPISVSHAYLPVVVRE